MITKILREIIADIKFRLSKPHEREIQDFEMYINNKDPEYSFRKTLRYYDSVKAHEPATTKIFRSIVLRGDTVLDIGANIGYFTLLARKLVGINGFVFSFEPEQKNYDYLLKNIRLNKFDIDPINAAVGDKEGEIDLFICPYDSGHHTINQKYGIMDYRKRSLLRLLTPHKIKRVRVPMVVIDNLIKKQVDVVKIDVEGAELGVLKGMKNIINNNQNIKIIIEFFPLLLDKMGTKPEELIRFIKDCGFNIFIIPEDYSAGTKMIKVDEVNCSGDKHINLLLTRKNYVWNI